MNIRKNKALIGFLLLGIGTGYAINGNSQAINDSKERGAVVRGVICQILTDADKQSYAAIPAEAKAFHIDEAQLRKFTNEYLQQDAKARKKLQPATPKGVCYGTITPEPKVANAKASKR